jgi:cytidine deaminase
MTNIQEDILAELTKVISNEERQVLGSIFASAKFAGVISPSQAALIARVKGLNLEETMISLLPFAKCYADPPISEYRVGVVGLGKSGALYFGFNMEFQGEELNATVHGEQAAIINAWNHGEENLEALALNAAPCGHCRQFLYETNKGGEIKMLVTGEPSRRLDDLLPAAFGPEDLGVAAALMVPQKHKLSRNKSNGSLNNLMEQTIETAKESYAPYSKGYAAVGARTKTGEIYTGRYAENAAFNPSLAPLTATLVSLRLNDVPLKEIQEILLVETPSLIKHQRQFEQLLTSVFKNVQTKINVGFETLQDKEIPIDQMAL